MEYETIKDKIRSCEKSEFLIETTNENLFLSGQNTERTIKEIMILCRITESETIEFIKEALHKNDNK